MSISSIGAITQWEIRQRSNRRINLENFFQRYNHRLLCGHRPNGIASSLVRVMRDVENGVSVFHNMSSREDSHSGFVLERPFSRQAVCTFQFCEQFALERPALVQTKLLTVRSAPSACSPSDYITLKPFELLQKLTNVSNHS